MINYTFLSNRIRFGVADEDERFFAFLGQPNRNDDYYTVTEISEDEYDTILDTYGEDCQEYHDYADMVGSFQKKYIDGRTVLYQGWNLPDELSIQTGKTRKKIAPKEFPWMHFSI